jgi:hypothetical protein
MNNNIKYDILNKEEEEEQEQIQEKRITKIKKKKLDNNDIVFIMSIIFVLLIIFMLFLFINDMDKNKPCSNLYIDNSNIHGVGVYTKMPYNKNDRIFLAINNNKEITFTGSKINHCNNPNTELLTTSEGWNIVALDKIKKNMELTLNYNNTPNFIKKANPNWKC